MLTGERFPDYYSCLNLSFGAGIEDVKKSFRNLAKRYHPDNPETGSKIYFQKILKAYQILSSDRDRKIYDYVYSTKIESRHHLHPSSYPSSSVDSPLESGQFSPTTNPTNSSSKADSTSSFDSSSSQSPLDHSNSYLKTLPPSRVVFVHNVTEYAKKGLMRKGYRMKDRSKWTGITHDVEIRIHPEETNSILRAFIPLTVRVLCPECYGSDIHCSQCGGSGSYKSFRNLSIDLIPTKWEDRQILDLDLSRYRPDRLTYFKKKRILIQLVLLSGV